MKSTPFSLLTLLALLSVVVLAGCAASGTNKTDAGRRRDATVTEEEIDAGRNTTRDSGPRVQVDSGPRSSDAGLVSESDGGDELEIDAGRRDAGRIDAGRDAGRDAGPNMSIDAGPRPDAGGNAMCSHGCFDLFECIFLFPGCGYTNCVNLRCV